MVNYILQAHIRLSGRVSPIWIFIFVQIFKKNLMLANIKPILYFQTPTKPDILQLQLL